MSKKRRLHKRRIKRFITVGKKGGRGKDRRRVVPIFEKGLPKRSLHAWRIDLSIKASKVYSKITPQWKSNPNRSDVQGLDTPGVSISKIAYPTKKPIGFKISEGEKVAKAYGITTFHQTEKELTKKIDPHFWNKYKSKYPKEPTRVVSNYEYVWDENRDLLCVKNVDTGKIIYYISESAIPENIRHLKGEALEKAYAKHEAEKQMKLYGKYGNFLLTEANKGKEGWRVDEIKTPSQLFISDVRKGKIKENGLKLSENQVRGKPPESGYLVGILKGKDKPKTAYYKAGLVVKITGDYDQDLSDDHNTYGVITKVIDPWHYEIVQEYTGDKKIIRDTDVKEWVGDLKHDWIGIGKERHKKEIVPLIKKAMKGKIPIPEPDPKYVWKPDKFYPYRVVARSDNPKLSYHIKREQKKIEALKKKKNLYEPKDYKRLLKEQLDYLQSLKEIKKRNMGMATFIITDDKGKLKRFHYVRIVGEDKPGGKYGPGTTIYGLTKSGKLIATGPLGVIGMVPPGKEDEYKPIKKVW